jgi:hypothetical protein
MYTTQSHSRCISYARGMHLQDIACSYQDFQNVRKLSITSTQAHNPHHFKVLWDAGLQELMIYCDDDFSLFEQASDFTKGIGNVITKANINHLDFTYASLSTGYSELDVCGDNFRLYQNGTIEIAKQYYNSDRLITAFKILKHDKISYHEIINGIESV